MMRLHTATITNTTVIRPGVILIQMYAPQLTQAVQPGQYCMLRCSPSGVTDPLLRRPFYIHTLRRDTGYCTLLVYIRGRGTRWLASQQEGTQLDLLGPLGHGWTITPTVRNLLLICEETQSIPHISALTLLAQVAIEQELAVTLLSQTYNAEESYPPALLPSEVEYHIITSDGSSGQRGDLLTHLGTFLNWADAVYCSVSHETSQALYTRFERLRTRNFSQATLARQLTCGTGICYACSSKMPSGQKLVCRDGPVFDLREVAL